MWRLFKPEMGTENSHITGCIRLLNPNKYRLNNRNRKTILGYC